MAVITGIRLLRGVVALQADGLDWIKLRKEDFARWPLSEGDAIDPDGYTDRIAAAQMKDACEAALTLLESSEKTRAQLREKLLQKGFVPAAAEAAVERAAQYRFVDDRRYAKRLAEVQAAQNAGVYALKRKLRQKGVSEEDAEEAVAALDDDQQKKACAEVFRKIAYRYEGLPAREAKGKASQALARRGFAWDVISSVLENAFSDTDTDED